MFNNDTDNDNNCIKKYLVINHFRIYGRWFLNTFNRYDF